MENIDFEREPLLEIAYIRAEKEKIQWQEYEESQRVGRVFLNGQEFVKCYRGDRKLRNRINYDRNRKMVGST